MNLRSLNHNMKCSKKIYKTCNKIECPKKKKFAMQQLLNLKNFWSKVSQLVLLLKIDLHRIR